MMRARLRDRLVHYVWQDAPDPYGEGADQFAAPVLRRGLVQSWGDSSEEDERRSTSVTVHHVLADPEEGDIGPHDELEVTIGGRTVRLRVRGQPSYVQGWRGVDHLQIDCVEVTS